MTFHDLPELCRKDVCVQQVSLRDIRATVLLTSVLATSRNHVCVESDHQNMRVKAHVMARDSYATRPGCCPTDDVRALGDEWHPKGVLDELGTDARAPPHPVHKGGIHRRPSPRRAESLHTPSREPIHSSIRCAGHPTAREPSRIAAGKSAALMRR